VSRALAVLVLTLTWADFARACPGGDLLANLPAHSSRGVQAPERLTDGVLAEEGRDPTAEAASPMTGARPYVEWDLGEPTHLVAAAVQADNNDSYRISVSMDGKSYVPAWAVDPVSEHGLRERLTRDLDATGRYVRFEALSGDQLYAATEVRAYSEPPVPWPPSRIIRDDEIVDPENERGWQGQSLKLVLGLLAFPLLFSVARRLGARGRRRIYAAFVLLAALSWTQFGKFNGNDPLHTWDAFHYFMGTKYFSEVGYFDLYRCGAAAEREAGNGSVLDTTLIRDVEDNQLYPGDWTRTRAGKCRAHFSPPRWAAFKQDLADFRSLFLGHSLVESFSDHGFNATPLNVVWLRFWTHDLTVTRAHLTWLAQLDSVALAGTVAVLFWGFGPLPGVVGALVLGLGGFWSYHWVGGCIGRHTWLVFCAAGFAFLAKRRSFTGGVLLTLAGLLRLFPFVFVGAIGLGAIVQAIRHRRFESWAKRFLAGTALTFAIGTAAAGASVGFAAYGNFAHVFERHSHSPLSNQLGLSTLLSFTAGESTDSLVDARLTNPFERWQNHRMRRIMERRPLWALAVSISLGVIVFAAWGGASAAECGALSALLLFSALPMTSYDYTWLVVLVALGEKRPRVLPLLLAFALFTEALFVFGGETIEAQHLLGSLACLLLLLTIVPWRSFWDSLMAWIAPLPPAPPDAA
jgi:hypothetical protein